MKWKEGAKGVEPSAPYICPAGFDIGQFPQGITAPSKICPELVQNPTRLGFL